MREAVRLCAGGERGAAVPLLLARSCERRQQAVAHKATGRVHGIATLTCRTLRSQPVAQRTGHKSGTGATYFGSTARCSAEHLGGEGLVLRLGRGLGLLASGEGLADLLGLRIELTRGEQVRPGRGVVGTLGEGRAATEERLDSEQGSRDSAVRRGARLDVLRLALEHTRTHGGGARPLGLLQAHLRLVELTREPQRHRLRLAALWRLELAVDQVGGVVVGGVVVPVWKTAALSFRPVRTPARPASARSSSGRPPASASLGQLAGMFWLAGHTGLWFARGAAPALRLFEVAGLEGGGALGLVGGGLLELLLVAELPLLLARLLPGEELDLEVEGRASGDLGRRPALAVRVVGAADERGGLALVHGRHARVPPLDHLALPDRELEEARAVARGVKLLAIEQLAHVVHRDLRAGRWRALRRIALHEDCLEDAAVSADVVARQVVLLVRVTVAVAVPAALLVTVGAAWTVLVPVLGLIVVVVVAVVAAWTMLVPVLRVAVVVVTHLRLSLAFFRGG
eukprot:scaffold79020_cov72-Phaeocystis_antarctica.AAC.3